MNSSKHGDSQDARSSLTLQYSKGQLEIYQVHKQKHQNGVSLSGTLLAVSPVTPVMAPLGSVQAAARELLNSILDTVTKIFGEILLLSTILFRHRHSMMLIYLVFVREPCTYWRVP